MNNRPLISAIVPVFNGERYIASAINSILSQTYSPIEIIMVNDGSTDDTEKIINKYDDKVNAIFKKHSGIGDTINQGIAQAQGEYISFLDADDLWIKNKLELQFTAINKSDIDMVFGYVQQFISPDLAEEDKARLICPVEPMPGYSNTTILIKKETLFQVGLFSTNYQVGEFIDWYMRSKHIGLKSLMLPNIVLKRRLHKTNTTNRNTEIHLDYVRVLKAGMDRRRAMKTK